jgi:hypothetical protein
LTLLAERREKYTVDICTRAWKDEDMSDNTKIHHSSQVSGMRSTPGAMPMTDNWAEVTCDGCRMEQPKPVKAEHRTPADVLERDALLSALDRLTAAVEGVRKALGDSGQGAAPVNAVKVSTELSEAAVDAMKSTPGWAIGAVPTRPLSTLVRDELRAAGLIGSAGGLTRMGSIWKEREANRQYDALFGPEC